MLFLHNTAIKVVKRLDYLGITFLSNSVITISLEAKLRKFYFAFSSVLRLKCPGFFKNSLLCFSINKCLPILLYF